MRLSPAANGPAGPLKTSLASYASDTAFPKPSALHAPDFSTPAAVTGDTSGHVAGFLKLQTGGWFTPGNLDMLADFMLVAPLVQWAGWAELRGNMARFVKLSEYYKALLA